MQAKSEDSPEYKVATQQRQVATGDEVYADTVIADALEILKGRMRMRGFSASAPSSVIDFLKLQLGELEHEVFCVMFLDTQNRLIFFGEMFRGTLSQTAVYPREIIKEALRHNAASVIFAHNHPSGLAEPSRADQMLTDNLKAALNLIDVRVLDHIIIGGVDSTSFAERGLI